MHLKDGGEGEPLRCKIEHVDLQQKLSEAEEALRRHIIHKTNRLYTKQGPDSSKAFLSALCTLSIENFDQLWAGVLHALTSNKPTTPSASDTGSRLTDSSEKTRKEDTYFGKGNPRNSPRML